MKLNRIIKRRVELLTTRWTRKNVVVPLNEWWIQTLKNRSNKLSLVITICQLSCTILDLYNFVSCNTKRKLDILLLILFFFFPPFCSHRVVDVAISWWHDPRGTSRTCATKDGRINRYFITGRGGDGSTRFPSPHHHRWKRMFEIKDTGKRAWQMNGWINEAISPDKIRRPISDRHFDPTQAKLPTIQARLIGKSCFRDSDRVKVREDVFVKLNPNWISSSVLSIGLLRFSKTFWCIERFIWWRCKGLKW